ncbi:RHS repeat family [Corallococcus coralloides DSM 2259]|uniref:RHS repeat family n=1 Tax=Corallococcus coralloides (strain ATCC 25202 / DSM 2259 / NBRC 100086 / M2) TaxID=1144275 RepID=H8MGJ6_CORCM|nr:RHS repeat family [Corallococcus coralloides DSM 2259]
MPVPVGSLRPTYSETDFSLSSAIGDFALTRTFSASTKANALGTPEQKLLTPFGRVMMGPDGGGNSYRWTHNLYSYVLTSVHEEMDSSGTERIDTTICNIVTPAGSSLRFSPCDKTEPGRFATSSSDQHVKLRWDGNGFTLISPEGRFRYTHAVAVGGQTQNFPPTTRWGSAYFLTDIEPTSYGTTTTAGSNGRRIIASIQYYSAKPLGCTDPAATFGNPSQLIQYVNLANGSRLAFSYVSRPTQDTILQDEDNPLYSTHECVLDKVDQEEGTSGTGLGTRNIVTYDYAMHNSSGQEISHPAGMLGGARFFVGVSQDVPVGAEAPVPTRMRYTWADQESLNQVTWRVFRNDEMLSHKRLHRKMFYILEDGQSNTHLNPQSVTAEVVGSGPNCGPGVLSGSCASSQKQNFTENVRAGDGSFLYSSPLARVFVAHQSKTHGVYTSASEVRCGMNGVNNDSFCKGVGISLTPQHSRAWGIDALPKEQVTERKTSMASSQKDARGAYAVFTNQLATKGTSRNEVPWDPDSFFLPPGEMIRADFGAVDVAGNGALLTKFYSYEYGRAGTYPGYEQQLKTETSTSAMLGQPGVDRQAKWTYQYESTTNRLMAKVRGGYTWDFTTGFGAPVYKYQATFYRTYRACSGETPAAADPQARVVEVEGPCWVAAEDSTSCLDSGPLTQYFYGAANAPNGQQQRLIRKRVSANVTKSTSPTCRYSNWLETTYDAYDEQGHLLRTTDPAYVRTHYAYIAGKLVRKTVKSRGGALPDLVTDYGYDNGQHGDYIRYPDGRYEVQCYRSGAWNGCTGGTLTDKLQWKATAPTANGLNYSERVNYFYQYGRLVKEETLAAGGGVRARRTYDADPLGRPTYQGVGEELGGASNGDFTYSSTRLFDPENNLIREGLPYLSSAGRPPAFCGGFNTTSGALNALPPECRAFEYDRLNRLVMMLEAAGPMGGSAPSATHVAYDVAGNVRSIKHGCSAGSTMGSCGNQPAVDYLHDDFGNLLEVKTPWGASASSGPSVTRFAYDSLGNPTVKQTSQMAQSGSWTAFSHDALGRLRVADARRSTQTERLFQTFYEDHFPGLPSGCPDSHYGQPHYTVDSFGATWFQYDAFGRLTAKFRVRGAETSPPSRPCNTSAYAPGKDSPNHIFNYDLAGRLVFEIYPYGRGIEYRYHAASTGMPHRVSSIYAAHLYPGGGSSIDPLITGVEWEPYGGVKSYWVHSRGETGVPTVAKIQYHQGGKNTALGNCSQTAFSQVVDGVGSPPFGRLSGLSVTRANLGDVFKRTYRYRADLLLDEDTCVLQSSSTAIPSTQYYGSESGASGFDARLQLRNVTNWPNNSPWADQSISYTYDARGNRTSENYSGSSVQSEYTSAFPNVDQLVTRKYSAPACLPGACLSYGITARYQHDMSGRVSNMSWYLSQTETQPYYSLTLNATTASPMDLGAVYRQVSSTQLGGPGSNYEYFYDSVGRRRLKRSWDGREDEYFYSGTQLLVDVGQISANPSTTDYVLDEYVWLDGRPVALIKSRFAHSPFLRMADNTQDCSRFGVDTDVPCGTYFPVTDGLGKPVLLLDSKGRISGVGDYEPFGHVNRRTHFAANQNMMYYPYMAKLNAPTSAGLTTQVRARLEWIQTNKQGRIMLTDIDGETLPGFGSGVGEISGGVKGRVMTRGWVGTPSDGTFYVSQGPDTSDDWIPTVGYLSGFEYRRFEPNAKPVWLPLRLPGQYYDPETDLFENWNRYYDPSIGRYLAPEPLASSPSAMLSGAKSGMSMLMYSYAQNNPISMKDADGNKVAFNLSHDDVIALFTATGLTVGDLDTMFREKIGAKYKALADDANFVANVWSVGSFGAKTQALWRARVDGAGGVSEPINAGAASMSVVDLGMVSSAKYQAAFASAKLGDDPLWGPPVSTTLPAYIAHELGHAWSYMNGHLPGSQGSIDAALEFEAAVRPKPWVPSLLGPSVGGPRTKEKP